MKIVAIGSIPLDFEVGCSNTLHNFSARGQSVNLIIPRDKNWNEKQMKSDELNDRLGISSIYSVENFDYSEVTQLNVTLLNSVIEKIKPSVAIIPYVGNSNKMKKVLAKSALLACRKVETILMYETNKNSNFLPTIYHVVNKNINKKTSSATKHKKIISSKSKSRKYDSLQRIYANNLGISNPVEAFESQRMILLQNDLF